MLDICDVPNIYVMCDPPKPCVIILPHMSVCQYIFLSLILIKSDVWSYQYVQDLTHVYPLCDGPDTCVIILPPVSCDKWPTVLQTVNMHNMEKKSVGETVISF